MAKNPSQPCRCYNLTPLKTFRKFLHNLLPEESVSASLTSVPTPIPAPSLSNLSLSATDEVSGSETSISDLPNNLLIEILLKVPFFRISSCRWVSKNWFNLISDPYFAELQLRQSPSNPVLLFSARDLSIDIIEFQPTKYRNRLQWKPRLGFAERVDMVVWDSCNGLLLLQHKPSLNLYIYNPVTGEHIDLPTMGEDAVLSGVYRLGYSHGTNSYKVIKLIQRSRSLNGAKIFEIGGKLGMELSSWRDLENVPYGSWLPSELGFVHGSLHWFLFNGLDPCSICCFDVEQERFELIPPPSPIERFNGWNVKFVRIWVLEGCLYVSFVIDYYELQLWRMKDYGEVGGSWTKEFAKDVGNTSAYITGVLPGTRMFLLVLDKALYSLDPETGILRWLIIIMDNLPAIVCAPSFISPKGLVGSNPW